MSAEGIFIIDAVIHPYHWGEDNWGEDKITRIGSQAMAEMAWGLASEAYSPEYALTRSAYLSNWSVDDTMAMVFHESQTDVAVIHHLPIYAFKDGSVSIEKTAEAREKYPNRIVGAYAGVDPLQGKGAVQSLEYQASLFKPDGIKMYPTSWNGKTVQNWRMDDPAVAFPILEKAAEMGIKVAAVHKAIPMGPMPSTDAYGPNDVEGAALRFPEMNFEVVHGGMTYVEETGWLMARFPNVFINLETLHLVLERRPRAFAKIIIDLVSVAGPDVLKRMVWGTGAMFAHPRPALEAFLDFQFPEDMLQGAGILRPIEQLTMENKADILGRNYARMHGWDINALAANIGTDEFTRAPGAPLAAPYTTGSKAAEIQAARQVTV